MLCDEWPGIEEFFEPGKEIIVIDSPEEVVAALASNDDEARRRIGAAFHARALRDHTYARRAKDAEAAFHQCLQNRRQVAKQSVQREPAITGGVA